MVSYLLAQIRYWAVLLAIVISATFVAGPASAQTPPPPDKVEQLVKLLSDPDVKAWLERQNQQPASAPSGRETTAGEDARSEVSQGLAALRGHIRSMIAAIPTLSTQGMRASDIMMVEFEERGSLEIIGLIAGFILVGLALDWLIYRLTPRYRHWLNSQSPSSPHGRLKALYGRFLYAIIMMAAFIIGSAGLFLSFEWPPLLREVVVAYLTAAIITRGVLILGRVLLLPPNLKYAHAVELRVLPLTDESAAHWYRWLVINTAWFAFVGATFDLLPTFGFDLPARQLLAIPVSVVQLCLVLLAVWLRPPSEVADADHPPHRRGPASWGLTIYFLLLCVLWLAVPIIFRFALAAFVLPAIIVLSHKAVYYVLRAPTPPSDEKPMTPVLMAVVDRGIRVLLIVSAALVLAHISGVDMSMMAGGETALARLLRGIVKALLIVIAADFGWYIIKALIARKLEEETGNNHEHGDEERAQDVSRNTRLRTLLPIVQNMLFAAILVICVLMVLSSLGIEIGPLIAGAGVIGVAIGFGAQTLVKDVISGIFYLLDDAFRVGEYIVSGGYKGTVEAFSLRSVKLRHHRGALFTVPFGELGAVQNMSRDWVIDKFSIKVDYKADIEKARKIVKKIGQELAADPEFAPDIIEPLKMQGVENFGDYGIELRIKMKTKPGGQFVIRRKALVAIKRAFEENGIEIPYPTVHVREGENPAAAAARMMSAAAEPQTKQAS
ncbi:MULTISPECIES: mechanosensitive ion channel domain-containing protein [unclassified Sinorhizobium]|uniref:mechanosensitive ion channel domain-containing protein n=1 Tax=unclassified Sinorhizobium TaxID=2613772 RepID=UPI0035251BF3